MFSYLFEISKVSFVVDYKLIILTVFVVFRLNQEVRAFLMSNYK